MLPYFLVEQKGWSLSLLSLGERKGTPWTGCQSITGPHRDKQPALFTLIPRVGLESPINFTYMFLGGGRKLKHPEITHAYTRKKRKHANSNQESSCCDACVSHSLRETWEPCFSLFSQLPKRHLRVNYNNDLLNSNAIKPNLKFFRCKMTRSNVIEKKLSFSPI